MMEKIQTINNLRRIDRIQTESFKKIYSFDYDGVSRTISNKDKMYPDNEEIYGMAGRSALHAIFMGMIMTGMQKPTTIMDFACGYGRVLRYIKIAFPESRIYGCEYDKDALRFCVDTFNIIPIQSGAPDDATATFIPEKIDVIWVGSLFTHFNIDGWHSFMGSLYSSLNDNGILVFSSTGELVVQRKVYNGISTKGGEIIEKEYHEKGFGFAPYANVKNMAGHKDYGLSAVKPEWTINFIKNYENLRLVNYAKRGWVLGQDLITCVKDPV